ncbi:Bifunctional purine biosynthetic protein ade1 [Sorochytrium milnesiophthora]
MALLESNCPGLRLIARGKVRDLYDVDDRSLLFVATDRLSAFDVVMTNGIPAKGKILTAMSVFWFGLLKDVMPNHLITADIDKMPDNVRAHADTLRGRCLLVKKLKVLPVEAIVRGYLSGSGWQEYKKSGTICGIQIPAGLVESSKLPQPIFTPSTKAAIGEHGKCTSYENIHPDKVAEMIGEKLAKQVEQMAIKLYTESTSTGLLMSQKGASYAAKRGIIIADTKFEFGVDEHGTLYLADEVLTPDSSRFWPAEGYKAGAAQNSLDKQYVRDYLLATPSFDKKHGIEMPQNVVDKTRQKYERALELLTSSAQ